MADWCLLIIENKTHLVDLDLKITKINKFGNFPSASLKKEKTGQVFDFFGREARLISYNLSDIQKNLVRGPQIISPKDIAWIVYNSDIKSNDVVVEAGGGSGALTMALAQASYPNGRVITFEKNIKHYEILKKNLELSPFSSQVELRNKELNDEITEIECNSIILDLPEPHKLIKWAERSLVLGGKLLCYVPTINQVEKLLSFLDGWAEVEISDIMHRNWQINLDALRPKTNSLGHTGFILTSRLLNK